MDYMIAKVLIDNGSSLNVLPKVTLDKLCSIGSQLKANSVMDIRPAYSSLLSRPWIHAIEAIPSSLHQRVKFIMGQQLINVIGGKGANNQYPTPIEYIKEDEEALETSF
ncbi:hypothetical protein CR513_19420, partial [Mucuna pruriens]